MGGQFNAKTYVVEPLYRDDGLGLWDFGNDAPSSGETLELPVEAARVEARDDPDQASLPAEMLEDESKVGRARPVAPDRRGLVIAKYPEWDRAHGVERPEWTTVREVAAQPGDPRLVEEALERADVLRSRIGRLVRGVRVGRSVRLKRQLDGHDLDVDAMLDAGIALRMCQEPDPRIFRATTSKHRDLAVLLLLDVADPLDLVEDARRAAVGLRGRGIDGFGVVLGSNAMNSAVRIFGRGNTMLVPRIEDLPARLSELYFRLVRR